MTLLKKDSQMTQGSTGNTGASVPVELDLASPISSCTRTARGEA
ncbi:hypothetical protein ACFU76_06620 [Streptomyces sp. NPDC057539]